MDTTEDTRAGALVRLPTPAHIAPAWLAQPVHSPERRLFSVLCWRGWCDHEFKRQAIAHMITGITGVERTPVDLPVRVCPTPATCECECHDAPQVPGETA